MKQLHADYSDRRAGTLVRDDSAWQGSLCVAGNPGEDFRVARRDGEVVGYARFITLEKHPILAEFGRSADDAEPLASLLSGAFAEAGGAYGPDHGGKKKEAQGEEAASCGARRTGATIRAIPRTDRPRCGARSRRARSGAARRGDRCGG